MQNISILFWQRKNDDADKKSSVICRITVNSERVEITTEVETENRKWNQKGQKVNGSSEEAYIANRLLNQLKNNINNTLADLNREEVLVTAKLLKYKLSGGDKNNKKYSLLNTYQSTMQNNDLAHGTLLGINSSYLNMKHYVNNILNTEDIFLNQVDYKFIKEFEEWGKNSMCKISSRIKKKWKTGTIIKEMGILRKIMTEARNLGVVDHNPFMNYTIKKEKAVHRFLTEEELEIIEEHIFNEDEKVLEVIRDIFVFSCYTGLAYADLKELNSQHLVIDLNYGVCISKKRVKTSIDIYVPLLDKPKNILAKYKDDQGKLLPTIYNNGHNRYLDVIAKKCQINKKITTHVARHTAATYFLNNNIPEEVICKAIGLSSLAILRSTYGKLHDNTVTKHFSILNENIKKASG